VGMFKRLVVKRREERALQTAAEEKENIITDSAEGISTSPTALTPPLLPVQHRSKSDETSDRAPVQGELVSEGVNLFAEPLDLTSVAKTLPKRDDSGISIPDDPSTSTSAPYLNILEAPLDETDDTTNVWKRLIEGTNLPKRSDTYEDTERPYLNVGDSFHPSGGFVTRSPAPTDLPIYETAYQDDVDRIKRQHGDVMVYLNKRVEEKEKKPESKWDKLLSR